MNPYQKKLEDLVEQEKNATVTRADAPDVTGKVVAVDENGCTVNSEDEPGTIRATYIAHRDIRGISSTDWDYDSIAA